MAEKAITQSSEGRNVLGAGAAGRVCHSAEADPRHSEPQSHLDMLLFYSVHF